MTVELSEISLILFAVCNSARVFAYLPQMIRIGRDRSGVAAVSCATWLLFAISNVSTAGYGLLHLGNWQMAVVFGANAACCSTIVGLTLFKRRRFRSRPALRMRMQEAQ